MKARTLAEGRPSRSLPPEVKAARRLARFWAKAQKTDTCWIWTGSKGTDGYGNSKWNGETRKAHRLAYELTIGPIPEGWEIDHLCLNTLCVRPEHLESVTPDENMRRKTARRTTCKRGHPFDTKADGTRWCRTCARDRGLEYARNGPKGGLIGNDEACGRGHAWTDENTYVSPKGNRYCRTCRNQRRNQSP